MPWSLLRRRKYLPLPHVRLIALALLAVLLPAITLLVVQYRSLCHVEYQTQSAVRENLREAAEGVARTILGDMGRLAEEVLLPVPARFFGQGLAPWSKAQSQEVFQKCPEIRRIFFVVDDPKDPGHSVAYIGERHGQTRLSKAHWNCVSHLRRAIAAHEKADLLEDATPRSTADIDPRMRAVVFWQDSVMDPDDANREEASYVIYCLVKPGTHREVGFAGIELDMGEIRRSYLPTAVSDLLRNHKHGAEPVDLVLGIVDHRGEQIWSSGSGAGSYTARASLGPVFPQWEASAGFRTTDINALASSSFHKGLWFTVLVFAVLMAGIGMIVRGAVREVKLAEAKQTFVSNVSHELKTPLASIRLFAETLEMGRATSEHKAREYYRIIHNESRRLSQLIDNILDFSRIEAGSREYDMIPTDLGQVTRTVLDSYEYQIRAAGFELVTDFDPHLPLVTADPDALSQAILNLLNNAVKYSPQTKHISVRVQNQEGGVAVEITDRGIGIPLSEQKRIFEKFYRVCTGLVHETKGSGLGLALVKHIIEAHQGRVLVESAPGKGSRFTLWLPAADRVSQEAPETAVGGQLVAQSADHRG
jgi:signal transduction histidine kinase